ncbi:MAG: DUF421 domain-containing protein [Oscillospiraceae bacterium]|jgi:uncharacterized membrane protein YcaP (DUF421 family)|nr:DUF421 domain-containing protein [Oscillospiraceae bacterium]
MLILFLRAIVLFVTMVVLMRLMGKRQISQLQPYELALSILIANLATAPMGDTAVPLLYGVVPMIAMIFMHTIITLCCMKSVRLQRIIDGRAYAVIQNGSLNNNALDRLGFTMTDLLAELRAAGFLHIQDVNSAILETSGKISVFPVSGKEHATASDLGVTAGAGGAPVPLILSGQVQRQNLPALLIDEEWLLKKINEAGFNSPRAIALASLDPAGTLLVYGCKNMCAPVILRTQGG